MIPLPEIETSFLPSTPPMGPAAVNRTETPLPALPAPPGEDLFAGLKKWQREIYSARLVILREIDGYRSSTGRSLKQSIEAFLTDLSNGGPEHLKRAVTVANNRKGNSRMLSRPTIYNWYKKYREEGIAGLIPEDAETTQDEGIPLWAPAFLETYRQPSKPSISAALKDMGADAPPYHKVIRFLKKFSNLDICRGRMSGAELRAIRAYIKRDFSDLLPMDVVVADGHSFKAYVAHPVHGKRFLPEVEAVIDVASRCCVGWSVGLAESGQVVADALRHAATISDEKPFGGLFAILYADNGPGNRAKMNSDEVTGIVARLGGTVKFGRAGNPQARGVIERLNESLWIPSAKKLVTYNGRDMDALAQRRRLKVIDKDLKETGSSKQLPSWRQFIEFLSHEVAAYNNQPHASLPKITPPYPPLAKGGNNPHPPLGNGGVRHMSPIERWQSFAGDGWQPDTLSAEEMRDLFRPQVKCTTRRGLVTVFTNEYFNAELEHHHGDTVFVNYDIHDPNIVWVRNQQQQLICEAAWGGNKRAYFPIAVVEQAREQRKERRLALKREQIREIEEEARGVADVEEQIPEECVLPLSVIPANPSYVLTEGIHSDNGCPTTTSGMTKKEPEGGCARPLFPDEIARYEWHLKNGFPTDDDLKFKLSFEQTDSYRMLRDFWQ